MEQILGKNCNQIFSGAPYRVQKDQGHLITSVFGIRGTVPGTKSSGALWILLTHPNSGHGRETQNIGCLVSYKKIWPIYGFVHFPVTEKRAKSGSNLKQLISENFRFPSPNYDFFLLNTSNTEDMRRKNPN